MNQSKKKIDATFADMYDDMMEKLEKHGRLHYLKIKKLNKGIKVGDIRIRKTRSGYVLKKGYNRGYSIIEKNIYTKKAAIMLAVFYNKGDQVKYKQVFESDIKYGSAIEKLLISKERIRHYAKDEDWFKVDLIESRVKTYVWNAREAEDNLIQLYYNYVF